MSLEMLTHNRVELALHTLRHGTGRPLLLLHGLGEQSPNEVPDTVADWTGPITALDFTGHGASTMPIGGGYTAEMMMADADAAIQHLGETTIVGRGLGAYVALLIAGARPQRVRGVVLADGPGLSGGPSSPTSQPVFSLDLVDAAPDPYALAELGRDLRPPDYATAFSRLALQGSDLEQPITVVARFRPSWLRAVAGEPGVGEADSIRSGLDVYLA
jgi:pimeloyl-ACP methyl ester carboxylesterase